MRGWGREAPLYSEILLTSLPDEAFDNPLGESTGAAVIFGVTGGVMEAALRTAYEVITGQTLAKLEFAAVRGLEGIKAADVQVGALTLKVAVASGLGNARVLLDQIKAGKSHENPAVQQLYKEFLGQPLGHLSHDLLHTHYHARGTKRAAPTRKG